MASRSQRGGKRGGASRVVLLCGGRGSGTIATELQGRPDAHLSVVVNGYDDGLSTGALRRMIPGILGPSDFRKVFAALLDPAAPGQRALRTLLGYRFTSADGAAIRAGLEGFSTGGDTSGLPPILASASEALDPRRCAMVRDCLARYCHHVDRSGSTVDYTDFALGNAVIAGIYLKLGDFNATVTMLGELCRVPADVVNVSDGECRWLTALKADGSLLAGESEIVAPQSAAPIADLYLLRRQVTAREWRAVERGSWRQKHAWLSARDLPAASSREAEEAISGADVIIYGPGTQHSSLYPSYRVAASALKAGRASVKALVVNLDPDHDIRGLSAADVVERALHYLEDIGNGHRVITHVVYDPTATLAGGADATEPLYRRCARYGIVVVPGSYRDAACPATHGGRAVVDALLALRSTPIDAGGAAPRPPAVTGRDRTEAGATWDGWGG